MRLASLKAVPVEMRFSGANPSPKVTGLDELPGRVNYFLGKDRKAWHTGIRTYAKVRYENLYPGVSLIYYGNQRQLEYDFEVAAGADPRVITLGFQGVSRLQLDGGDLVLAVGDGASTVRLRRPFVYQEIDGVKREISGRFVLKDQFQVGFELAAYDSLRPLVIDPILVFSTYLGGRGDDSGNGIAVDVDGNVYVTGSTSSTNFPTTPNAFDITATGTVAASDAFVIKLDPTGTNLVYATYLGGSGNDQGNAIAVDADGNAFITGFTESIDFPLTNAFQQACLGCADGLHDAFVAKLDPEGANLLFSTYLGGRGDDIGSGIAVDSLGNVCVTGFTTSTNFPTVNAIASAPGGGGDAFLTEFDPTGTNLLMSTYLGGSGFDVGNAVAIDTNGNIYVTGSTSSTNFPTTPNAFDITANGTDAFVIKIDPSGTNLIYSTFLGGSGVSAGFGIAADAGGFAYVTGYTTSTNFPLSHPFQFNLNDGDLTSTNGDAFVTKVDPLGITLVYSSYLGGSGKDVGNGIAVDAVGNVYVTGTTGSTNFPTVNPIRAQCGGCGHGSNDAFVAKIDASGTNLVYSTYLGGNGDDAGQAIAIDTNGNAYVTGKTGSRNFPRGNSFQVLPGGKSDAFITKISEGTAYDLAVVELKAPRRVALNARKPNKTVRVTVRIQERSQHSETITNLSDLVSLEVTALTNTSAACSTLQGILLTHKPQKPLPITLLPKSTLTVYFEVTFGTNCVPVAARSTRPHPNHGDYRYVATVNHAAIDGHASTYPEDDVCPRSVTPPYEIDPNPDGTIIDRGCGARKPDGTFGGDIVTDVVAR
jgi:hypothetical protein